VGVKATWDSGDTSPPTHHTQVQVTAALSTKLTVLLMMNWKGNE
jgi:hypothetical protein